MNTMKRLFLVIMLLATTVGLPAQSVAAQEGQPMTDAQVDRIKTNCADALSTIQQLHASDGPLYVNRVQLYDSISTKLMSRFNSRLVLNKLDAAALVKVTSQYDKALSEFRSHYKQYDEQMGATVLINCRKQPVTFYDAAKKARVLREAVHGDVLAMHDLIGNYQKEFDVFYQQFRTNPAGGGND